MAQSDYELAAHVSGLNQRTEINSIFDSILTHNSGSTAPTVTKAFMMWVDTSNATYYYLKMRNHDNTAWVTLGIYTVATKTYTSYAEDTVKLTGNQTIDGIKTFSSGIKIQNQNVSPFNGFKNYIINGKKIINQRALLNTDNSYNQDRWYKVGNNWYQGIEGDNNLISGKTYTLSWTGVATASYYVGTATSSTINAQSFTTIANGANFTPTITAGQNLWIKFASDATGSTFNFVQLEEGSIATPFENRPYGLELSLCQRYLPVVTSDVYSAFVGQCISTTQALIKIPFKTVPRVAPTGIIITSGNGIVQITNSIGGGITTTTPATLHSASFNGASLLGTVANGLVAGDVCTVNIQGNILFTGCEL